ncbi:MAG: ATP-binding protein [Pirellulaceae bacterium]|nr:ATP-binding protein [Pirellulaceae bacterium]
MMLERSTPPQKSSRDEQLSLFAEDKALDDISNSPPDSSFLLSQLEVYNWGPFRGIHRAQFDPAGTAIIGPTGSGKTTLVDALMTLLVASPRYNLASTGGHESDRTLIEYVRGVLGGDGADGRQEVARPGKTISGICATYICGEQVLKLAALLWTEGTGNSADDLKRRWVFSLAQDHTFEKWLRMLNDDGVRDLLKMGRETAGLRFFDSKRSYLERVRKFFDVGENAFTLLNRAAGLKQLNSIDEIFRELVLDDKSAFDRAIEVAAEFDNLAAIHAELELAKKQQESLVPVQDEYGKLLKSRKKTETCRTLKKLLPVWFAQVGELTWGDEAQRLTLGIESLQRAISIDEAKANDLRSLVDSLREQYLELGGNVIGELENTIKAQKKLVEERRRHAQQYLQMVARFELKTELSEHALLANQATLAERQKPEQDRCDLLRTQTLEAMSELRDEEKRVMDIEEALTKVKRRPGSNIPPNFQDFRSELASQLSLPESELPFLAELIEVKPSESAWRGAIERAIGSERLRVLVPQPHLDTALHWINHRDNRLHVRLQAAGAKDECPTFFADGYISKLNFKTHALSSTAQQILSGRDLHCVSSPAMLRNVEHGLTVEGMMSGRRGKFEKQDQRRIDQDWMTGFDNKDQLESLARQLIAARETAEQKRTTARDHQTQLAQQEDVLKLILALLTLDFSTINSPNAESELASSLERLKALLDPDSDASQAKMRYESENQRLESLWQSLSGQRTQIAVFDTKLTDAEQEVTKARGRKGKGLTEDERLLANKRFKLDPDIASKHLRDEEDRFAKAVEEELGGQMIRDAEIEQQLVRKMELAKRVDSGALSDVGSGLEDVPHYLERLRVLNEEALPEKRTRFLEYLNRSSDQGVTQLLASIDEEVDAIEQRIGELNHTLVKVDFREGRYLQLQPQRMKDERLRALNIAMQKVRSAALKDDGGDSHFRALQGMVAILREAGENRRLQGSKALLDPRFRLQFFVVEVDRKTGDRSPPRTGSQSGSGGEKELMASHILTASLSYALCPAAATRPLYGTVILDEAFSKSSPSAASRIIEALRIFNLHPIFVTPNKEIGLLKQHTRKVICVQRPNKEASLTSISWERLEELARTP